MRRLLPFLLSLLPACTAAPATGVELGDQHYRLGRYGQAYEAYQAVQTEQGSSPELDRRLAATRFEIVLDQARRQLHLEEPRQALALLPLAERMRPGSPVTADLRLRCHRKLAAALAESGRDLFGNEDIPAAADAFTQAVAWDPENALAQEGVALARARLEAMERLGDEFFFLGLEELRAGAEDRAFTALQHAVTFWGEDNRAAELLDDLALAMARRAQATAEEYLAAGLIAPAWLALRDAEHLHPGLPGVAERLAVLEDTLLAEEDLQTAEIALLGGHPEVALAAVARSAARRTESLAGAIADARFAAEQLDLRQRYTKARACEIEGLVARAARLYDQIAAAGAAGFEDVALRLEEVQGRLARASASYRLALEAESAGDRALYLERLRETVREARDYQDASARLRAAAAAPES